MQYSKTSKKLAAPTGFLPETKAEYDVKVAQGIKSSFDWKPTGTLKGAKYRILFNRKGEIGTSDSAFYFNTIEEVNVTSHLTS